MISNCKPNDHRSAFTLIELLVVMGIIGILTGITLPAIHAMRESSRMLSCQNNLRNLAMSMHSYESSHRVFPSGQDAPLNNGVDLFVDFAGKSGVGHLVLALPFMDQQNFQGQFSVLFGSANVTGPWFYDAESFAASNHYLPSFVCPSDTGEKIEQLIWTLINVGPDQLLGYSAFPVSGEYYGWTNYLGSRGSSGFSPNKIIHSGIFFEQSRIRPADISDGLSNTVLMGEVVGGTTGSATARKINSRHSLFQNGVGDNGFFFDDTEDFDDGLARRFSSHHRSGHVTNFSYADGHIAAISSDVDMNLMRASTTRSGGRFQ